MDNKDVFKFVKAVNEEDNVKAKDLLEKILKEKCSNKISSTLNQSK